MHSDFSSGYSSEYQDIYFRLLDRIKVNIGQTPMDISAATQNIDAARNAALQDHAVAINTINRGGRIRITSRKRIVADCATEIDENNLLLERLDALSRYKNVTRISMWPIPAVNLAKHQRTISRSMVHNGLDFFLKNRDPLGHVDLTDETLEKKLASSSDRSARASTIFGKFANPSVAKALVFYEPEINNWIVERKSIKFEIPPQSLTPLGFELGVPIGKILTYGEGTPKIATRVRVTLVRDAEGPNGYWIKKVLVEP